MTSPIKLAGLVVAAGILLAQTSGNSPVISNQKDAVWTPESGTPGADGALLREDPVTGGLELFVHYPRDTSSRPTGTAPMSALF